MGQKKTPVAMQAAGVFVDYFLPDSYTRTELPTGLREPELLENTVLRQETM